MIDQIHRFCHLQSINTIMDHCGDRLDIKQVTMTFLATPNTVFECYVCSAAIEYNSFLNTHIETINRLMLLEIADKKDSSS